MLQPGDAYPTTTGGITTATMHGRLIQSRIYQETWTDYDPERRDLRLSPERTRRPLPRSP